LVVERDIARNDGKVERSRGFGYALDAADELAHRLRPLRIAEIEIVGQRERARSDGDEVPPRLRDRLFSALARVSQAIALGAIDRQRQTLGPVAEPDDGGVAARALDRVAEDERVI